MSVRDWISLETVGNRWMKISKNRQAVRYEQQAKGVVISTVAEGAPARRATEAKCRGPRNARFLAFWGKSGEIPRMYPARGCLRGFSLRCRRVQNPGG